MGIERQSINLPAGIGPHEGRELDLMLAGRKPLARFSEALIARDILPEAAFAPHVAAGSIVKHEVPIAGKIPAVRLYYALPEEAWRIEALCRIDAAIADGTCKATDEIERKIGRLLGYAEADIEVYIAWINSSAQSRATAAGV